MTKQEILDGNTVIAELFGAKVEQWYSETPDQTGRHLVFTDDKSTWPGMYKHYPQEHLKYHSDWNWLMIAIRKVLVLSFEEESDLFEEDYYAIIDQIPDIEATFEAVVETIKKL